MVANPRDEDFFLTAMSSPGGGEIERNNGNGLEKGDKRDGEGDLGCSFLCVAVISLLTADDHGLDAWQCLAPVDDWARRTF